MIKKISITILFTMLINCFAQTSTSKIQEVLENNIFVKSNGLTSLILIHFENGKKYTLKIVTTSQVEVVNVTGTYTLSNSERGVINLILYPKYINKSAAYNVFEDFKIDKFIYSNLQFDIRRFVNSDIKKYVFENPLLAQSQKNENRNPVYILHGNVNFYSSKLDTKSEREAKIKHQEEAEKKKNDLEEKLKGW